MKKVLPVSFTLIFFSLQSFSQLLSWIPDFIRESITSVVVMVDALGEENHGLLISFRRVNLRTIALIISYDNNIKRQSSKKYQDP